MNVKLILALVLLAVAVGFGWTSFRKTMTPYISFAEARQSAGMVQVNGVLADKNYVANRDEQFLEFQLKDETGDVMRVEYRGVIPGNFDQATSIVAIGRHAGDHFEADQLLVKCPSKYQTEMEQKFGGEAAYPGGEHPGGEPGEGGAADPSPATDDEHNAAGKRSSS